MADYKVVDTEQLNTDLTNIAKIIREKSGLNENLEFPQGFIDAINGINNEGNSINFKDIIQERIYNNERPGSLLLGTSLTDVSMFDFSQTISMAYMFSKSNIENLNININSATSLASMCAYCSKLINVTLEEATPTSIDRVFISCSKLETVELLNMSNCTLTTKAFENCNALKDIGFVPETINVSIAIPSPVLSNESIQSIINGLATVETTQTLTLHADVKAKLTEEQLATITNKNWNLA